MNTEMKSNGRALVAAIPGPVRLDKGYIPAVKAILARYADQGVLLERETKDGGNACPTLDDDVFLATNELSVCTLDFTSISKASYESNWQDFLELSFDDFLLGVKCGIFCLFGSAILASLRTLIRDFVRFVEAKPGEAVHLKYARPTLLLDILLRLPVPPEREEARDELAFSIENAMDKRTGSRRTLPDFHSIFTFHSILKLYWQSADPWKDLFWPVYLWFMITGVVPLRPIEFLVTPFQCLRFKGGQWFLTLRRSLLKGGNATVGYSIRQDFMEVEYRIPEWLAEQIRQYQEKTAPYGTNCLGTLLSPGLRYAMLGLPAGRFPRYYTYSLFTQDLILFYEEVVGKRYNLKTVEEEGVWPLEQGLIRRLHPGDTRHLAAINLVESGTPIHLAQLIMRHSNPNMTAHYAGNLNAYAETAVKSTYRHETDSSFAISFDPSGYEVSIPADAPYVELDEGRCYSPRLLGRSAQDCVQHRGPGGRIGWCPSCPYFRSSNPHLVFVDSSRYMEEARYNWKLLTETVDHYRQDYGHREETLAQALMRAKSSLNIIRNLLDRQMERRAGENSSGQNEELQ